MEYRDPNISGKTPTVCQHHAPTVRACDGWSGYRMLGEDSCKSSGYRFQYLNRLILRTNQKPLG
ncbi:hypothetical protein EYF80_061100 [Liparis tanakae]|uniref:Uncharacterized protein n=1 Tax=Liparis tanakae TaxID=230148 RepID=A0A4Z2EK74_9TELE|nr:hypothetical protein EYF80_061100 [Liparis tanakae]